MLGFIGFSVAALVVSGFVASYRLAYPHVDPRIVRSFSTAFAILAVVMAVCAVSVLATGRDITPAILVVDVLMLIATGFMLDVIFRLSHPFVIALLAFAGAVAIAVRAYSVMPTAYVQNGLLHFNLEGEVRTVLLGGILLIWLPASFIAVARAVESLKQPRLKNLFMLAYIVLVLMTATFFSTRTELFIVVTFAMMIAIFAAIAAANLIVYRYGSALRRKAAHGK